MRIAGLADFTDPGNQPGGSTTYADLASYSGDAVTVANNGNGYLTWDTLGSGVELLDRTDPAAPLVLVEGIYAVTANVTVEPITAAGYIVIELHLDHQGQDAVTVMEAFVPNGGWGISVTNTYFVPEGGEVAVRVRNFDGVASRDFTLLEALVQRTS